MRDIRFKADKNCLDEEYRFLLDDDGEHISYANTQALGMLLIRKKMGNLKEKIKDAFSKKSR